MLVDVNVPSRVPDPQMSLLLLAIGTDDPEKVVPIWLQRGVYEISHFSFEYAIGWEPIEFKYLMPNIDGVHPYGVCDSVEQLITQFGAILDNDERRFVISVTKIQRENQFSKGGWRWHKWGPYIGIQKPQHEYLYDDTHIDWVFCFHIFQVPNGVS